MPNSLILASGQKMEGLRGCPEGVASRPYGVKNFLPASRSEAPPPRALGAEAEAEKFSFPFRRKKKIGRAQNKKCEENFSARQATVLGGGWRGGASGFFQEFLIK